MISPTLADQAYDQIEELIVTLQLAPGTFFTETDLSRRLRIGRTPIREALQQLIRDQLVKAIPRKGMMVTDINIQNQIVLLETRRALDRVIAEKAAKRANEDQRIALKELAYEMDKVSQIGDIITFMHLDHEFDRVLQTASRNPYAVQAVQPLNAHCRRFWYFYQQNGDIKRFARMHIALMNAVVAGDQTLAGEVSDEISAYHEQLTMATVSQ
jgi:DNA-binding GntR family transcriptional regulator